MAKDVGASYNP